MCCLCYATLLYSTVPSEISPLGGFSGAACFVVRYLFYLNGSCVTLYYIDDFGVLDPYHAYVYFCYATPLSSTDSNDCALSGISAVA